MVSRGVFGCRLNQKKLCVPSVFPDLDLCIQLLLMPTIKEPNIKGFVTQRGSSFCLNLKRVWI